MICHSFLNLLVPLSTGQALHKHCLPCCFLFHIEVTMNQQQDRALCDFLCLLVDIMQLSVHLENGRVLIFVISYCQWLLLKKKSSLRSNLFLTLLLYHQDIFG